uniref:protein FAR1-RELATED SEQUENCE 7-like n=1 Tax=Erigeron canadensis TaxID=72917 RepID=UPI001CB97FB9|nr:protein FAR1-RELATED SEQUENCE 7-like [Erigeron canadensis]
MDNQEDMEIIIEDEPCETHLINEIDANGYLVSSEFESETGDNEGDNDVIGMVFDTPDDAYLFYNQYAFLHGFGIRIHETYKNRITKEQYQKIYVCNKEGFKDMKGDKKRRRPSRTGCEAMFRVSKRKDGKWVVDRFYDAHNHELTSTPTKVMKHRSHGKLHRTQACKALMTELNETGLRPCHIKKVVNKMKGSQENDVTSKQVADVLSVQRKQYRGWVGSPRNLFWADGRSRDSYMKFLDVVVFDVTYMTNRFKLPFAPFVGVNHHGQSIIFGGALLENEKQETFEWLFKQFSECMFGKHPSAIITNQDKAIGNAIRKEFPNTRHRYCSWHISRHEAEHIPSIESRYSGFQEAYRQWVKSDTVEEFETRWKDMDGQFNFQRKSWIVEMYKQRHHWANVFLKDFFFAGMTTSGRSESIHSFFDGYVNSNTMLNEFVVQYDNAVKCRRRAEEDEDFQTMNTRPVLSSVNPLEAKAGARYTKNMFEVFKKEWIEATNNLTHETLTKSSKAIIYKVGQLDTDKKYWRMVHFCFSSEVNVTCSCAKFETYGILCKHILYVLKKKHIESLLDRYILPRWTLDARYKEDGCSIQLHDINSESGVSALTLWCVQSNSTKAIEQAKDSVSEIKKLNTLLLNFLEEQTNRKGSKEVGNLPQASNVESSQVNVMPQMLVRDPLLPTVTKGRPKKASRIKSPLEAPKMKTCSYCKGLGHYITGCPTKKAEDALLKTKG